jgi:hypothetical protein
MPGYPPQIDGVDRWESGARYAGHFFSCLWAGGSDVPDPDPRPQLLMFRYDSLGISPVDIHALGGVKYIFEVGPRN